MSEYVGRFDFENLLSFEHSTFVNGAQPAFDDDDILVFSWNIPYGASQEAKRWLYENRTIITDQETPFRLLEGTYRTVKIESVPVRNRDGEIIGEQINHSLAKGYYTSIGAPDTWTWGRVVSIKDALWNSSSLASVSNAGTDSDFSIFSIRFPYIEPSLVNTIAKSLNASTYSNPVVHGETIAGDFHNISVSGKIEQDGTASIVITLARPQYVLLAYSDVGGSNESDVTYLWNVPLDIAQGILDDYKAAYPVGATATADYSMERSLVNLTLRKKVNTLENLSTGWVQETCDTSVRYHFAWGYTKTQVDAFIQDHDELPFEGVSTSTGSSGMYRKVRVEARGDGLYDVIVEERWIQYDEDKHLFTFSLYTGSKIVDSVTWGWNAPMSVLEALRTAEQAAETNVSKKLDIKRNDGCSFDYVYTERLFVTRTASWNATGAGINLHVEKTQFSESLPSTETAQKRVRLELDVQQNELGTFDYEKKSASVVSTSGQIGDSNRLVKYGKNTDSLPNETVDGMRFSDGNISPNDDGSIDFSLRYISESGVYGDALITGDGVTGSVSSAHMADASAVPDIVGGKRVRVDIDIDGNDDGSVDWKAKSVTVQAVSGSFGDSNRKVYFGKNTDGLPGETVDGMRFSDGSVQPNDDGTIDYNLRYLSESGVYGDALITGNGITGSVSVGHRAAKEDVPDIVGGKRVRVDIGLSGNDDGSIDWSAKSMTVLATSSQVVTTGPVRSTTVVAYSNQDSPINPPDGDVNKFVDSDIKANDDGTVDGGIKIVYFTPLSYTVEDGAVGLSRLMKIAKDQATLAAMNTPGKGRTVSIRANIADGGGVTYVEDDVSSSFLSVTGQGHRSQGVLDVSVTVEVGKYAQDLPADDITGFGTEVELSQVSINDDDTYDYVRRITEYSIPGGNESTTWKIMSQSILEEDHRMIHTDTFYPVTGNNFSWTIANSQRFLGVFASYTRNIDRSIERVFSISPIDASGAPKNHKYETGNIDGIVWYMDDIYEVVGPYAISGTPTKWLFDIADLSDEV